MKSTIEVKTRAEGTAIARGLDPVTKATAAIVGVLLELSDVQQSRVLRNVKEALDERSDSIEFAKDA